MKTFFILFLILASTLKAGEQEAIDAYIYGFPLVLMDATKEFSDFQNAFKSERTFPDPSFKLVVSPNADTLYSQAWLDLSKGPIVFHIPDMGNRYYLYPMLDEWTNVFFSPGTRTTGQGAQDYAIKGPGWKGELPQGLKEIKAPTDVVWMLGRIETMGPSDYAAVNKLQDQFKLTPLSNYPSTPPLEKVWKMDGPSFFQKLSDLLKEDTVKKIGSLSDEELTQAVRKAQELIKKEWVTQSFTKKENGWNYAVQGIGSYGTDYLVRAVVAYGGLGANLPQDAIYPFTRVDTPGNYVIHFNKAELPPVKGFWSITLYNDEQFFVPNPINRYAIHGKDPLKFNADGSLDIFIQHDSPGKDRETNWLPAPVGPFNLIMRLYGPEEALLKGAWIPPKVERSGL